MVETTIILEFLTQHGLIDGGAYLTACHGGDIHQSYSITVGDAQPADYFVKVNRAAYAAVLQAEYQALLAFKELTPGCYPTPLVFESLPEFACLVMAYHQISPLSHRTAATFGAGLAQQHLITQDRFGWPVNNYIGLTKQHNEWMHHWPSFFWQQRLAPQLSFAAQRGLPHAEAQTIARLEHQIDGYFDNYNPKPALLHGDLWSGNAGFDLKHKQALFYDPAPYYGDPETDLAMTELFGRFPQEFYTAYYQHRPQHPGSAKRKPLYNLYHALNHFVLFGQSYLGLVQDQLAQLKVIEHDV